MASDQLFVCLKNLFTKSKKLTKKINFYVRATKSKNSLTKTIWIVVVYRVRWWNSTIVVIVRFTWISVFGFQFNQIVASLFVYGWLIILRN